MHVTARGVGLAATGAALLGTGFGLGYPELALLGSIALLAVLAAVGYAAWRPRLTVHRRVAPDRVTRGESSLVTLTIHNGGRLRPATLLARDRCGPAEIAVPVLRLRPGRDTVVTYPVPTSRRGVVHIGPLRITRRDPLGLVTVARTHGGTAQVWVHPRSHPLAAVPAGITRSLDGRVDRVPHGSITFASLREYVVGDELRHVHWRTSARIGELMVREHVDTSLPRLVVLLDDRAGSWPDLHPGGDSDGFESACEAAASVIAAAAREDLPIVLHQVGSADATTPRGAGRDPARLRPLLDRLAEAAPEGTGSLGDVVTALRRHRLGDTLVYLTGAGGVADLGAVTALRGPYPAVVVGLIGLSTPPPSTVADVLVLDVADGPQFAAAWDGVRSW